MKSELQIGVEKLCTELKNDPSFFYSWQSNIAMEFVDEWQRRKTIVTIPDVANEAAKNFLNRLINLHAQPPSE